MYATAHAPNRARARHTTNTTAWVEVSKSAFVPAWLQPGMTSAWIRLRAENASAADGALFYYKLGGTIPTDDNDGQIVSGSGQTVDEPGITWGTPIYIRKTTGTDEVHIDVGF